HNSEEEQPSLDGLNRTGTLVQLLSCESRPDGTKVAIVRGVRRVRLQRLDRSPDSYLASIEQVDDPESYSALERVLQSHVVKLYSQHVEKQGRGALEAADDLEQLSDASALTDYIGNRLITDWRERQRFLDILHPADRLERLAVILGGEAELLELEAKIRTRVRQQIDKSQREYYLREQLKVIYDELSGEGGNEMQALRDKVETSALPDEVREKALREIGRLERMPSTSPEGGVVRTYLDWILSLPWSARTEDTYDLAATEGILEADHYGLDRVKERIVEFLAVRELTARKGEDPSSPILCLVGPPGVGKTSLGKSIARSLGRSFVRISLGGVRDEAEIRGHRRTYVGALPGRLIHGLRTAKTNNPVFLLDEIDKMSSDFKGDPSAALLEVLDPEQNSSFIDHYMELPFDLSKVLFIATANTLDTVPRPLLDRMEVVQIGGYTEAEKVQIARRYLLPRQLEAHGLDAHWLEVSDKMLVQLVRCYTREAGVRNLERQVSAICRKAARKIVGGRTARIRVTSSLLEEYLGPPRKLHDVSQRTDQIGLAMGMAWTELGGTLLPVEVATMPGKGVFTITGRLGEVMQESAKAALSFARSRARELDIPENFQETTDWHIHLPEGAVPKDGPSAGITMATGMISALTRRPVRSDVAMTGEVTLRGRVLAIGGLKEKVLAAHQAGIKQIVAPIDNQPDLATLPRHVKRELTFHWVESMDEVLAVALHPAGHPRPELTLLDSAAGFDLALQVRGQD
ncbi:MAG: endopeptidase La, partial [Chloroflexota bacterium]|nr:endopeptidase La [Chloroflexota bacterium]